MVYTVRIMRSKSASRVDWLQLTDQTLEKFEAVLAGRVTQEDAARWAVERVREQEVPARHVALASAWQALAVGPQLKEADAHAELERFAAILGGKADYTFRVRYVSETDVIETLPASSLAPIDVIADQESAG